MLILAIDTTGFSASIALVKDGQKVLFNKINSGFLANKNWWDFPHLLPAHHQKFLINNIEKIFQKSKINWPDIEAIAVSANSGIYNCLLIGLSTAETLAYCHKKPLIKVDHILAHIYSPWLERNPENFQFPILVFSASGSHSDFSLLPDLKTCQSLYSQIPVEEKEDSKRYIGVGKLFFQLGKMLHVISPQESNFQKALNKLLNLMDQGQPNKFDFKKYYQGALFDLDFTDLMKSVEEKIKARKNRAGQISQRNKKDIAASFQESVTEIISDKIINLAKLSKAKEIHLAGGISENEYLKRKLDRKIKKEKIFSALRYPVKKEYRLDNAAMIGALAYYQEKYQIKFINFKPQISH